MSAQIFRIYIYVDRETKRVLYIKKSVDFNFSLSAKDFYTEKIVTPTKFPPAPDFNFVYDPVGGLRFNELKDESERARLLLSKRKVEILLLLKTSLLLVSKDVKTSCSDRSIAATPIDKSNFFIYSNFVKNEKRILLSRIAEFFNEFKTRVEDSKNIEMLNSEYAQLANNVYLGVYSATNRERKGIGV